MSRVFSRDGFRAMFLSGCVLFGGCIYKDEPLPAVVPTSPSPSPVFEPPRRFPASPVPAPKLVYSGIPADWHPPSNLEKNWTAIVVHHSATQNGNAAIFDRWHREGNHWEGVGYDFVIGNGTDSPDGMVEVTFRWRGQRVGAHCGGTYANWANRDGIGICLVGDFNKTSPTPRQMQSLTRLVRFLQSRYRIPAKKILGHNTVPGARTTDCPGRKFPMSALRSAAVN